MNEAAWFGARLRELREQAGLTQEQLAERCGVKWEAVSRWERGTREPSWSNVIALSKSLRVECTAFLQEPVPRPLAGPGRPRKVPADGADQQQPKRPRGRPRKAAAASQETRSSGKAGEDTAGQKPPRGKRKGKGE